MAFPTTTVLDDFNRADGAIGSNWSGPLIGTNDVYVISSNKITPNTSPASEYWNPATYGPDCECFVSLTNIVDGDTMEVHARYVSASKSGYAGRFTRQDFQTGFATTIYRVDSGAFTILNSQVDSSGIWAATDKVGIEIIGTTIKLYRFISTWSNVNTNSGDATYSAANFIGLRSVGATETFDDFGGGTIAAAAAPVSARPFDAIPFI